MVQIVRNVGPRTHPNIEQIRYEVEEFMDEGTRIPDSTAQAIASWWHSPASPNSTRLSTQGRVTRDMTISDFANEAEFNEASEFDKDCLEALEDYIEFWKSAA